MRYLRNVVTLYLNEDRCIGCGRCREVCPHNVFSIGNDKAAIRDRDACIECGGCSMNCPVNAISVDTGTGCAIAVIRGLLTGTEPSCDCSDD